MVLDELPAELLPLVFRHLPPHFLWTNVRPVCRRMNNAIRRNVYWLRRLSELYGLRLPLRLTMVDGGGGRHSSPDTVETSSVSTAAAVEQPEQSDSSTNDANFEDVQNELMPSLRCVAIERRVASRPFDSPGGLLQHNHNQIHLHHATIDALRLFRHSDGPIWCLSGARDRQIVLQTFSPCDDDAQSSSSKNGGAHWTELARVDNAHDGWIWCISVVPSGANFYSAGWDMQFRQWHLTESGIERGQSLKCGCQQGLSPKFAYPPAALCCVAEGPNVLYAGTYSCGPTLFDLRVGPSPQHELHIHGGAMLELCTGSYCNKLFSIGADDRLVSVDKRRFSELLREHHAPVSHVDYAEEQLCLSLKKTGQLRFFDPDTLEMENHFTITEMNQGPHNVVKLTRGATFCATRERYSSTLSMYTPGLRPRLMAHTELSPNVTRLDVLDGAVVAALSTGDLAYFYSAG